MLRLIEKRFDEWRYRRYSGDAPVIRFEPEQLREQGYFSQFGQDKLVAEQLAPGIRNGVFVDIGAYDGVSFSNTVYLERERQWTGIAIEPEPGAFEALKSQRSCRCIQAAVSNTAGTAQFVVAGMLSGDIDAMVRRHHRRIGKANTSLIDVPRVRLNDVVLAEGLKRIDYLSIDVEGAEYSILSSIAFERINIRIIGIENNYYDSRISSLLYKRGYRCICRLGVDEFYMKDD
jgi:FkbM family methyltransferase